MPWTIENVDEHKKGLSDKQKKQWVRIAHAALKACMKKGGTDEECAPKAIIQANGVVNVNSGKYAVYKNKPDSDYDVTLTVHQERPCYVVPVVMMVEGVHSGSHGPLLHTIDELGRLPAAWNGIPVVMDHPEDEDGTPISANSPSVIDKRTVGRVYNTNVDGTRLCAEVWLDEEKLNSIAPEILEDITNNKLIEVSVGVFSEEEEEEGEWNGEAYIAKASNYKPDHLAILTEYVGACSCEDGCGLRNNSRQLGHEDIEDKQDAIAMSGKLDAEQPVVNISVNLEKEDKMSTECKPCIKERADALIANNKAPWTEDDREFLQTLSENQLDKMKPIEVEKIVEKVVEKEVQVNALTDTQKAALAFGEKQLAERRASWIDGIQVNTSKEVWPDDVLKGMSDDMLERLSKSIRKEEVVDYSIGSGAPIHVNAGAEEPMAPAGVEFETKK